LPSGIDEPLSRSPSRPRRTPAGGRLQRRKTVNIAKRMLHDHSLTLDETGFANFALLLRLASNWPHFNRIINIDE
jgi:hypothetical protein